MTRLLTVICGRLSFLWRAPRGDSSPPGRRCSRRRGSARRSRGCAGQAPAAAGDLAPRPARLRRRGDVDISSLNIALHFPQQRLGKQLLGVVVFHAGLLLEDARRSKAGTAAVNHSMQAPLMSDPAWSQALLRFIVFHFFRIYLQTLGSLLPRRLRTSLVMVPQRAANSSQLICPAPSRPMKVATSPRVTPGTSVTSRQS